MRLSIDEYNALIAKREKQANTKTPKYRNRKVEWNGYTFDSKKELVRYQDLLAQQNAGQIKDLARQMEFKLNVNGEYICTYVADFVYRKAYKGIEGSSKLVVEDVKSRATRKLPAYVLKKKLMNAIHKIEIQEI